MLLKLPLLDFAVKIFEKKKKWKRMELVNITYNFKASNIGFRRALRALSLREDDERGGNRV